MAISTIPWGRDLPRATSGEAEAKNWGYWQNRINRASLIMLSEAGIVSRDEARTIARAQLAAEAEQAKPGAEPVTDIMPLEKMLIARCGQMATLIHTGRSRQDIFATLNQARLRVSILDFAHNLNLLREQLTTIAKDNTRTWMPAYTNGVQAMPITFGFYLWAFLDSFARDFDRIREAWQRINRSALGSAVLANSTWAIDRARLAELLGFDGPLVNGLDSSQVSLFDVPIEAAGIAQNVAVRIATLMQDIAQQYSQTRPWLLLDASAAYASSAMPQKRNPGIIQKTRAKASDVVGAAQTTVIRAHNLQLGMYDNKESVTEDNTAVLVQGVHMLQLAHWAFSMLTVLPDRALEELDSDWTCSMALAETLQHGHAVPFRVGHGFASEIVTEARKNGYLPKTFPYAAAVELYASVTERLDWKDGALPLTEEQFRQALHPERVVSALQGPGSPAPESTAAGLANAEKRLRADKSWIHDKQNLLAQSDTSLDSLFEALSQ
jgi:argininosuccinate lyase